MLAAVPVSDRILVWLVRASRRVAVYLSDRRRWGDSSQLVEYSEAAVPPDGCTSRCAYRESGVGGIPNNGLVVHALSGRREMTANTICFSMVTADNWRHEEDSRR